MALELKQLDKLIAEAEEQKKIYEQNQKSNKK